MNAILQLKMSFKDKTATSESYFFGLFRNFRWNI